MSARWVTYSSVVHLRRIAQSLVTAMLLSCAAQAPTPAPRPSAPAPPATPDTTATEVTTPSSPPLPPPISPASSAPTAAPVVLVPPPAPAGVDEAIWSVLADLCPVATWVDPAGQLRQGCRSWPPWDGPDARPDGRAPRATGPITWSVQWDSTDLTADALLPFVGRYQGAFTRPGADQLLLYFEECRRMDGITITGCAAIVERRDDKWTVVGTHREAAFGDCVVNRRAGGRDLLVCHNSTGASMESITTSVFYLDFGKPDGSRRTRIAELAFNSFAIQCRDVPPAGSSDSVYGFWTSGIVDLHVEAIKSKDIDRDGDEDVTLELDRIYLPYSPQLLSRVRSECKNMPPGNPDADFGASLPTEALLPKPTRFQLQFSNDGKGLAPTSGTRRVLTVWAQQHPPRPYAW